MRRERQHSLTPEARAVEKPHANARALYAGESSLFEKLRAVGSKHLARAFLGITLLASEGCFPGCNEEIDKEAIAQVEKNTLDKQILEFQNKIRELIAEGNYINFFGVTLSLKTEPGKAVPLKVFSMIEDLEMAIKNFDTKQAGLEIDEDSATPLASIEKAKANGKNSRKTVNIPTYQIVLEASGERIEAKVINWLSGQEVTTHVWSYYELVNATKLPESDGRDNSDEAITAERKETQRRRAEEWSGLLRGIQKDKTQNLAATFEKLTEEWKLSETARSSALQFKEYGSGVEKLRKLAASGYSISLDVMPKVGEVEDTSGMQKLDFFHSGRELDEYDPDATIKIDGNVTHLKLSKLHEKKPADSAPIFKDRYGNIIIRTVTAASGGEYFETIDISVPTAFVGSAVDNEKPVSVDLSRIGIDLGSSILFHEARPALTSLAGGKYQVFSSVEGEKIKNGEWDKQLEAIAKGAADAERFYGLEPGTLVKNIYIINTKTENGMFVHRDPTTIVLTDEHITSYRVGNDRDLRETAFHEASHLIDAYLEISDDSDYKKHWEASTKEFLRAINESNFMPGSFGGHAQDNEKEFLASFTTGLADEKAKRHAAALPGSVRREYVKSIEVYRKTLEKRREKIEQINPSKDGRNTTIPIFDRLTELEEYLK